MKNIDIRSITVAAAARISGMDLEQRTGGWYQRRPTVTRVVVTPDMVRRHLLSSVWTGCLDALGGQEEKKADPVMTAELALAELIRRGVPRENIRIREGSFRLKLENSEYRIHKRIGAEITACPWPADLWSVVRIGGELFAEFVLFFDAHVPEIVAEVPAILGTIRGREMEERKRTMERTIRETAVRSLLEQHIKPLGLSAGYHVGDDGCVTLDLRRTESARLEIPMEELPEVLGDTESVLASLITEPARIYDENEGY